VSTATRRRLFTVELPTVAYLAVVLLLMALFAAPLVWLLLGTVKGPAEFAAVPPTYLPREPTLDNYRALDTEGIWRHVGNSVLVTVGSVLACLAVSTLAGYGFARFRFRFQSLLLLAVLSTLMIPFQSNTPALYTMLDELDLTNSPLGLILLYTVFALPFGVLTMRVAFAAVPRALEESAIIDGLSSMQVLLRVMVPLAVPGLATVALYAFFNGWNEFLAALTFTTRQEQFTLPVALANLQSGAAGTLNWGVLETGAVVSTVPCVAIFLILQRYYVAGLTAGAVKE
jgi:multiple sugar transport system permease protein